MKTITCRKNTGKEDEFFSSLRLCSCKAWSLEKAAPPLLE